MNKSVSLLVTVILLTQIASFSFNNAPSSVDSEDIFTSDEQWLVSGRNGSSAQVWSTPVSLDSTDDVGEQSSLAIDSNDNLHVTYLDYTNGNLEYMTHNGSSWSTPVSLDSTDSVGLESSLAIDSNDNLHVTYRDDTNDNLEYMTYDGSSWSTPVSLDSTDDVGYESSLAIDSSDNLHVTYYDQTNENLEYMTYDGSSWSTPVSLDSTDRVGRDSSLAIDSNDNLHVTYLDHTNWNLEYMIHNGSSWSTPISLDGHLLIGPDSTGYVGEYSSLAIDSNDNLHVTYHDGPESDLEYMTYDGSSWSTPVSLDSTDNVGQHSSLAIDSNDNLHVTYRDHTNYNLEYMTYDGSSWSTPVSLDSTDSVGLESSLAIDSSDNLHVTYYDTTNGNLEYMTAGNNTGGNNSGNVNNTSNECLMFNNVSYDYNYSAAPQDSFNITADLFNYCTDSINYPSTLILSDTQGLNVSSDDDNWRYMVGGNSSYPVSWLVARDSTVVEGTIVTFEIHPTIDNCSENCTESQNYSYNLTIPFGLVDLNTCYKLDNVSDDYLPGEMSFNLSASLNNTCVGDIHYPSGVLYDGDGTTSSPVEGAQNPGAMAYMINANTSTTVNWLITINQNISNETLVNYSLQPACSTYNLGGNAVGSSLYYMQDCSYSTFDSVDYSVLIEMPSNQTVNETGNNTDGNNSSDCLGDTSTGVLTNLTMAVNSDYTDGDNLFTIRFMINCAIIGQEYFMDFTISGESGNMYPIDSITTYSWIANRTFSDDEISATWDLPLGTGYCLTAELYYDDGEWISNDNWCPFDVTNYTDSDDNNTGGNTSQSNDTDMDGFDDIIDNCPNVFSNNQNDLDNDGIGDVCDLDTEMDECVFADIDAEENTEVIFYLNWVDSSGNQHCGTLQFELYSDAAPIHSQNFRDHVSAGNYDGVKFHRIIDNFMIQGGDIQNGDGTGGYAYSWHGYCSGQSIDKSDCPDENYYSMPDEFSPDYLHQYGALSMAHSGPNTGGSQFFIMDSESATWLDAVHTVFGQAIAGTIDGQSVAADSVINAISQVDTSSNKPTYDVTIISAEYIELQENEAEDNGGMLPGFSSIIAISALFGAAFVRIRKE